MKRTFFLLFLIPVFGFFVLPQPDVWTACTKTTLSDATAAKGITSFDRKDPESMIIYFYASMVRKDGKWKDVLSDEKEYNSDMKRTLEKYKTWDVNKFQLVKYMNTEENKRYVKIKITLVENGVIQKAGTDDVTVQMKDGQWAIVELPS